MRSIKRLAIIAIFLVAGFFTWSQCYTFDVRKATTHLTEHGRSKSIHCCAWYTMRALQSDGCPAIILPAQWYKYFLPLVQFEEVASEGYLPQAGDVVRNNEGKKKRDQFVNTVDDVERITGMDFFPALPDSVEDVVEAYANLDDWR